MSYVLRSAGQFEGEDEKKKSATRPNTGGAVEERAKL